MKKRRRQKILDISPLLNTEYRTPEYLNTVKNALLSDELKTALLQWDDTDEETRAASKARLDALGSNMLPELVNAVSYVEHRFRLGRIVIGGASAFCYAVMIGMVVFLPHERHAPAPPWVPYVLACCLIVFLGGFTIGISLLPNKIAVGLAHALACYPSSRSLRLLLRLPVTVAPKSPSSYALTSTRHLVLVNVLHGVSEADVPLLNAKEQSRLRRLVHSGYPDLCSAALQALIVINDATMLPVVRKLAKRTREWEMQEAISDYLRRFAPDEAALYHSVNVEAAGASEAEPANAAPIFACVMRLGSRNPAERQAAENALRNMQPEELAQVLQVLDQEAPADRRVSHAIIAACFAVYALFGSLIYFWVLRWPYFDAHMALEVAVCCAIGSGLLGFLKGSNINYARRNRRRARMLGSKSGMFPEKRLLETLSHLENLQLIGTILDHTPPSTTATKMTLRRVLRLALQNLLPRLRASDANLLSEQHRNLLNHELQRSQLKLSESWAGAKEAEAQAGLDAAILKVWEQVGDERALAYVQQLASMPAKSPAKKRVKAAAQECLPYLEARVGEQRQTQTLLRAAEMPAEAGDILLRAATPHAAPVESEQLLRAGIRNSSND